VCARRSDWCCAEAQEVTTTTRSARRGPAGPRCGQLGVRSTPHTPWGREPRMPRPAGPPQPRAPTARASRDDSRQGPTPHRPGPSISLVRWRHRALRTQRSWRPWLARPRLDDVHALAAFHFKSLVGIGAAFFCIWSGRLPWWGVLPPAATRSVGAPFPAVWRLLSPCSTPHAHGMHGLHAVVHPGMHMSLRLGRCLAFLWLDRTGRHLGVLLADRQPPSSQPPLLAEHALPFSRLCSPSMRFHSVASARRACAGTAARRACAVASDARRAEVFLLPFSRLCSPSMRRHRCSPSMCCGR